MPKLRKPATPFSVYKLILILALLMTIAGTVLSFYEFRNHIDTDYRANDNQFGMQAVGVYAASYASAIDTYYSNALNTIGAIAANQTVLNGIKNRDSYDLGQTFEEERTFNQEFNTIIGYDASGDALAISSDTNVINTDLSNLDPAPQAAINSHKIAVLPGFMSKTNHQLNISFIVPVFDSSGDFVGTIDGISTLNTLASHTSFLDKASNYTNVLVDANGNILEANNKPSVKLVNIGNKEPLLKLLSKSNNTVTRVETNYLGQNVIAEGTPISFGNYGRVYAISFTSCGCIEKKVNDSMNSFNGLYRIFILVNTAILLFYLVFCYYVISKAKAIKQKTKL